MKITIKYKSSELSIECDDSVKVSINTGDAKGRCCRYEVIGEVPVEEHQDNILSKTAVDTRFTQPKHSGNSDRFSASLESVFANLTDEERGKVAEYFDLDLVDSGAFLLSDLLLDHTYTDIRTTLRRLFN